MATPEAFSRRVRRRAAALEDNVAKNLVGRAADRIGAAVVRGTPVATGFARSNWVAARNRADRSARPIRSEAATVGEIQLATSGLRARDFVVISNGGEKVPYLGLLNSGSSVKAPAGFIRLAILAGLGSLQGARVLGGFTLRQSRE